MLAETGVGHVKHVEAVDWQKPSEQHSSHDVTVERGKNLNSLVYTANAPWEHWTQLTVCPTCTCWTFLRHWLRSISDVKLEGGFLDCRILGQEHFCKWNRKTWKLRSYKSTPSPSAVPPVETDGCINKPRFGPQVNHNPAIIWPPVHSNLQVEGVRHISGRVLKQSWKENNILLNWKEYLKQQT